MSPQGETGKPRRQPPTSAEASGQKTPKWDAGSPAQNYNELAPGVPLPSPNPCLGSDRTARTRMLAARRRLAALTATLVAYTNW